MKDCLNEYFEKQTDVSNFVVHYHIGDSFSGETEFRLEGDGKYELWSTATKGRQRKTYTGQVEVEQVKQMVKEFLDAEVWEVRHFRDKPGDDDPEASIEVECGGQKYRVALWVSEIRKSPQFVKAQQALLTLAHTLSAGEVLESGK